MMTGKHVLGKFSDDNGIDKLLCNQNPCPYTEVDKNSCIDGFKKRAYHGRYLAKFNDPLPKTSLKFKLLCDAQLKFAISIIVFKLFIYLI